MRLVIMGAPGAGKGTQAQILAADFGIPHVATGVIFRQNVDSETPLGLRAKAYMDRGELVPDEIVIGMVAERLAETDAAQGFILDGFPRTVPQAEALEIFLQERDTPLDVVIRFEVPEEELLARLEARREQEHRTDDDTEVIRKRLVEYRSKTAPLVTFYSERGLLRDVHALGSIEDVAARTKELLADLDPV